MAANVEREHQHHGDVETDYGHVDMATMRVDTIASTA
jgi:hypothetical protein